MLCPLLFQEHERIQAHKPVSRLRQNVIEKKTLEISSKMEKLAKMAAMPSLASDAQFFRFGMAKAVLQVPGLRLVLSVGAMVRRTVDHVVTAI